MLVPVESTIGLGAKRRLVRDKGAGYLGEVAKEILAVITTDKRKVTGAVPIFIADSEEEKEKTALFLAKTLDAMVHDLENGCYFIVRH